jgi:hypothetical protein
VHLCSTVAAVCWTCKNPVCLATVHFCNSPSASSKFALSPDKSCRYKLIHCNDHSNLYSTSARRVGTFCSPCIIFYISFPDHRLSLVGSEIDSYFLTSICLWINIICISRQSLKTLKAKAWNSGVHHTHTGLCITQGEQTTVHQIFKTVSCCVHV